MKSLQKCELFFQFRFVRTHEMNLKEKNDGISGSCKHKY